MKQQNILNQRPYKYADLLQVAAALNIGQMPKCRDIALVNEAIMLSQQGIRSQDIIAMLTPKCKDAPITMQQPMYLNQQQQPFVYPNQMPYNNVNTRETPLHSREDTYPISPAFMSQKFQAPKVKSGKNGNIDTSTISSVQYFPIGMLVAMLLMQGLFNSISILILILIIATMYVLRRVPLMTWRVVSYIFSFAILIACMIIRIL